MLVKQPQGRYPIGIFTIAHLVVVIMAFGHPEKYAMVFGPWYQCRLEQGLGLIN
jgi:hypothetical protein